MTSNNGDRSTQQSRKHKISEILTKIEKKLEAEVGKATIADYVRVIQLERELEEEQQVQPKALKVTWIEPSEMYDFEE